VGGVGGSACVEGWKVAPYIDRFFVIFCALQQLRDKTQNGASDINVLSSRISRSTRGE
jgi:hypothetical protein